MTDKVQKIRKAVENRYEYWRKKESNSHSIESEIRMSECQHLLLMLDSLQEEPVSEDLEEASKEWLRPQLDKSYANYGEEKMMELTHFDGYTMLDAIEFGAKWKEHQMMKDAIDAERTGVEVNDWKRKIVFSFALPDKDYEKMNKVKVIIIKSE